MKESLHDFGKQEALFDAPAIGATAVRGVDSEELFEAIRFEYAKPMVQLQRERRMRQDERLALRSTAYSELGGGIAQALEEPDEWYEKYIDEYDDKQLDIRQAFEQFNLPNLTPQLISQMNADDRIKLALYIRSFDDDIQNRIRVFSAEGSHDGVSFINYKFGDDEEAARYADHLREFRQDFRGSDCWQTLQWVDVGTQTRAHDIKAHHGKRLYVVFDTKNKKLHIHYELPLEHQSIA